MLPKRLWPILFLVASLILSACGGQASTPSSSTEAPTTAPADANTGAEPTAAPAEPTTADSEPTTADSEPTAADDADATMPAGDGSIVAPDVAGLPDLTGITITAIQSANENTGPMLDRILADKFEELTGAKVNLVLGETSATDRLAIYRQQLSAGSADVDVYQVDVIWPGIIAEWAEDLAPSLGTLDNHFKAIVDNNTVDGRLVAAPYYTDAGLLYYRTDLLEKYGFEPPQTWAELEEQARTIQEGERATNPDFWGYVWQGKAYEGLTCNALEWQVSYGGGFIVEPDGTVSVNNPQVAAALERAKGWVGTISPPGVTTYQEEEARGVWQAGNAAFMRNWPYAYALGNAADSVIKDKFDVMPLPKGEGDGARNADTLGGWQLMVNKNSANKEAAIAYVKFLTSPEVQKFNAINRALLPTIPALYEDPEILEVYPFYGPLQSVFVDGAVARPSTVSADLYNDVSTAYFTAVNQVLTGQQDASSALASLENEITSILR
jgi:ABC-type sugar transport system, periplasmic component